MRTLCAIVISALFTGPAMAGTTVAYDIDGRPFEGYAAKADGAAKGLVLILHDWDGLTDYEQTRADMLAAIGYDTFAADLYGRGNRPIDTGAKKAETAKLFNDRAAMRARILAALDKARDTSPAPVIVIGYCFGGAAALELARSGAAENVKGYVTFHGGLATPEGQSYPKSTPPLLIAHGGADTSITMGEVAALSGELEAAGVRYEINVYSGAPHAFTVFGSDRYRKDADEKSWRAFLTFLNESF